MIATRPPRTVTLADMAADALRHYATQLDAAGATPGPTSARMLTLDRSDAAGALERLAAGLRERSEDASTDARAEREAEALRSTWTVGGDGLRVWARRWESWARARE